MKRFALALSMAAVLSGCTAVYAADLKTTYAADTQEELADVLADVIRDLPPNIEHGAFIYCDKTCWSSPIAVGLESSIPAYAIYEVYNLADTDLMTAFIHSHPKTTNGTYNINYTLDVLNEAPSAQDYLFLTAFATDGLYTQETTLYIVGPDTELRGYVVPRPQPKASE